MPRVYRAYSNYHYPPPVQPGRRFRLPKIKHLGLLAAIVFIAALGTSVELTMRAAASAASAERLTQQTARRQQFAGYVNSVISTNPEIRFSVSLINMETGIQQNLGISAPMDAASTGKLLSAVLYMHQAETGQRSLSKRVGDVSAASAIRAMINQSDDTAWENLNAVLGHGALESYAAGLGLSSYSADTNYISAADMTKLVAKLYQGKLLGPSYTNKLLSYMQNTNYEDFLSPAAKADGNIIYHKVGINEDQVNDTAVITNGTNSYALSVFTNGNGTYNWETRAALMRSIANKASDLYLKPS